MNFRGSRYSCHCSRMYEMGVAAALLERVSLFAEQHGSLRVNSIGIRVGDLCGIDARALSFGFETLAKDTRLAGARLHFEQQSPKHRCQQCGREFSTGGPDRCCPICGSRFSACISGEEVDISYVELEEVICPQS